MSKASAGAVAAVVVAVVTLAAVLGRDSESVAVPTEQRAIALVDAWLTPRFENVTVTGRQAQLVRSEDEFREATTFGARTTLGENGERLPVWVVTFGATFCGQPNKRALRYVIEAESGKFLIYSAPLCR